MTQLEVQLQEKSKRLEAFNKERDILERELIATKSELNGIKRTLGKLTCNSCLEILSNFLFSILTSSSIFFPYNLNFNIIKLIYYYTNQ